MNRLSKALLAILVGIDQLVYTLIGAILYLIGLMAKPPNPDETISSAVGKASVAGKWWGYPCSVVIDAIFYFPEGRWNHCIRHIEKDEL